MQRAEASAARGRANTVRGEEAMNDANDNDSEAEGSRSDLATSRAPGGSNQVEQSPARGRRAGLTYTPAPDRSIVENIHAWLATRDDLDPERVQALVDSGVVVLLGHVPNYDSKRRLEEFVLTVPGVHEVHDQLLVSGDTPFAGSAGLRTEPSVPSSRR